METSEITKAFFRANSESLGTVNFYETKEGIIIPLKMIIDIYKVDSYNEYNVIKYLMNIIDYNKGCDMKEDYVKTRNVIKGIL